MREFQDVFHRVSHRVIVQLHNIFATSCSSSAIIMSQLGINAGNFIFNAIFRSHVYVSLRESTCDQCHSAC